MKRKRKSRLIAYLLTLAMVFSLFPSDFGLLKARAESSSTNVNLLQYPSFEEDLPFESHQDDQVGNWFYFNDTVKKIEDNAHDGIMAAELSATNDALEQDVRDLQIGATYKVSVWAMNTNPSATTAWVCLKWYGGNEIKLKIDSTEYKKYETEFVYNGDSSGKNTRAAIWIEQGGGGTVYVDDWNMSVVSDITQLSIEDGKITAEYKEDYAGVPSRDDFDVSYSSSIDPGEVKELIITGENVSDKILEMNFDPIDKAPLEQIITVNVTYIPKQQTFVLDYTLDASGEEIIEAEMDSVTAENGVAEVILDNIPTLLPTREDFMLEYKVDDGDFQSCDIQEFSFNKEQKKVILNFQTLSITEQPQKVTVKVTYKNNNSLLAEYMLEIGDGVIYYIDAVNGNDNNPGTSEDQAWQTINKVNTIIFQPGDQILFKAGNEWTGSLKPQGSGVEGAPIVISSYGEGAKPRLMPGENWTISHMNIASQVVRNPVVNNGITFFNQEYWEVRNLELFDPTYEQNENAWVYRRGINISAEDAGDLNYFKFDNLEIHGFRGPTSNEGKSSGGIIMTVTTNLYDQSKRVPTAVHDISVTNCELYNLGRSGINFISPWTTREGDKWRKYAPFGYTGLGSWKPYKNFTLSNNIIHDIDGDGAIIDGCSNAQVDHNIVYRAVYNCWFGVGLFNWNSDDTIFEYNEVYESSPADALKGAGDGQGIEIDALNQNTLVQYNYLHNNAGGTFMWCNTTDLLGFNGIYRYNISQNDGTGHAVIDWRPGHTGSMAYNNTIYHKDSSKEEKFLAFNSGGNPSDAKFYNNIFVNKGTMKELNFNESEIDWERNIFVGYDKVPSNDTTIITEDPKFLAPDTGAIGRETAVGYQLQPDSPAINAGMEIENNGGQDYFGNPLSDGKTDIGACEYVEPAPEKASIEAKAEAGGTAAGGGTFDIGSKVTLTASAEDGYVFAGWYKGDEKVSSNVVFTIIVESDAAYTARFTKKVIPQPEKVSIEAKAETGGTVTGSTVIEKGSKVILKAAASNGYQFAGWYKDGKKVSDASNYTVLANENAIYTAKFIKVQNPVASEVGKVTGVKVSAQKSASLKISWKKTTGAKGYEIYRYDNKKWRFVKRLSGTSFTDKGLKFAAKYSYRIKAYNMDGKVRKYGKYSTTIKTATAPKKVTLKVKQSGKSKAELTWKKGTGADGFVIYYKAGKSKYKKIVKSGNIKSYKKSGLKKGKTYLFKVRGYKKLGKTKIYGKYSAERKLKLK